MQMNTATDIYDFITELNGEITKLTVQEIEALLEFRMADKSKQAEILKLLEQAVQDTKSTEKT